MGMTLTGKVQPYKAGFGAMMPDVWHLPFPNPLHGVSKEDALKALQQLFKADLEPARDSLRRSWTPLPPLPRLHREIGRAHV